MCPYSEHPRSKSQLLYSKDIGNLGKCQEAEDEEGRRRTPAGPLGFFAMAQKIQVGLIQTHSRPIFLAASSKLREMSFSFLGIPFSSHSRAS